MENLRFGATAWGGSTECQSPDSDPACNPGSALPTGPGHLRSRGFGLKVTQPFFLAEATFQHAAFTGSHSFSCMSAYIFAPEDQGAVWPSGESWGLESKKTQM